MPDKTLFLRFSAGMVLLASAVYIWGGVGLDPETVELALVVVTFSQTLRIFQTCFLSGIISLIFGFLTLLLILPKGKESRLSGGFIFASIIFALTFFPPQWLNYGLSGISICLLAIIGNLSGLLGIFLLASAVSIALGEKLPKLTFRDKGSKSGWLLISGVAFFLLTAGVNIIVFGGIPHIGDEQVQLWQAKMYAQGKFTVPAPDPIEFFFDPFMTTKNGRWFSQYPPGYAMLLAPGVIAGIPHLVNPLLAGLTLIIFGLVLKEVNASRWWVLLFALSPFVIFMSGSMMSHPSAMFWGALGIWAFLKSGRTSAGYMLLWGLTAGMMFSARPFTALCFYLPLAIIALRKKVGLGILTAIFGFALGTAPYSLNNYLTSGSIFTAGYQSAWDGWSGLFFTPSPWGPPHTPQLGLLHLATLLRGLNSHLFEFPLPALMGVFLWIFFKKDKNWKELCLFWAGICGFAGYYFYFYVDLAYGPRFAYESAFPLLIITALGIKGFYRYWRDAGWNRTVVKWGFYSTGIILLTIWGTISLPARIKYYSDRYRDVDNDFYQVIEGNKIGPAIVFLDDYPSTDRHARLYSLGFTNRQAWYYAWRLSDQAVSLALQSVNVAPEEGYGRMVALPALGRALNRFWGDPRYLPTPAEDMSRTFIPLKQGYIYMSPEIEKNDVIFARDLGAHNKVLMERFPEREIFHIESSAEGYKVEK